MSGDIHRTIIVYNRSPVNKPRCPRWQKRTKYAILSSVRFPATPYIILHIPHMHKKILFIALAPFYFSTAVILDKTYGWWSDLWS